MGVYQYSFEGTDIDKKQTAKTVKKFFKNQFPLYLARAGLHKSDLSSPSLSEGSAGDSSKNSAEGKMMQIFDYESKCLAVYNAIVGCSHSPNLGIFNRDILTCLYIKEMTDAMTQDFVNIWGSSYWDKKTDALCEFSERIQVEAFKLDTEIRDMRIWSDGKKVKNENNLQY